MVMNHNGIAHYKLNLAYDGTNYAGMQRQRIQETVQSQVEDALRKVGWSGQSIMAAGRTDAGVHAEGQVITFFFDWKHDDATLLRAINAFLPGDIAGRSLAQVPEAFHPRYDAISREYRYTLYCQPVRHPILDRYAWRRWPEPDLALMNAAAESLLGDHDFAAFGKPHKPGGATIRRVTKAFWQLENKGMVFTIEANAFLYHMVRRIVYVLVAIGSGTIDAEVIQQGLAQGSTGIVRLAPAQGLSLVQVKYENID